MVVGVREKIGEIRILVGVEELSWFRRHFPKIKWEAGDTRIKWNANDLEEVEMARKAYNAYKKKHPKAIAYRTNGKGKEAERIDKFDPNAEMILLQEWMYKG